MMTREAVIDEMLSMVIKNKTVHSVWDAMSLACDWNRDHEDEIFSAEVWNDDDTELIGICIEDETIYLNW